MVVKREQICTGLLTKSSFIYMENVRKIIFQYDMIDGMGHDLYNDNISYPINKNNKKNPYYISNPIYLNGILKNFNYPELLTDKDIQRILNEDFDKIFIKSGVLRTLYSCDMNQYLPNILEDNLDIIKEQFEATELRSSKVKVMRR